MNVRLLSTYLNDVLVFLHFVKNRLLTVNIIYVMFFRAFLTLQNIPTEECQIGKSKVFLRNKAHEPLEDKRKIMLNEMAIVIQRTWKGYFARKGNFLN